jgi:hypothetical protein
LEKKVYKSNAYLLLDLEDSKLEFRLNLRVLNLNALQAVDTPADGGGKGLNVTGGTADERAKLGLGESEKRGVLFVQDRSSQIIHASVQEIGERIVSHIIEHIENGSKTMQSVEEEGNKSVSKESWMVPRVGRRTA